MEREEKEVKNKINYLHFNDCVTLYMYLSLQSETLTPEDAIHGNSNHIYRRDILSE